MYPVSSGTATVDSRAKLSGRAASRGDRTPWALLGVLPSAPAPRRAGGVLPRARTGGGVSPSIAGGPLVSAGPRVSPYVEAQRTRKGGPGRSASGGAGGGGSPGRPERAPGQAGRQGLRGVVAAPFPSEPLAPRLSPRPEPSRRRSEYSQRARTRRCRRFQSRLLIIDTDIIFSPMNKDLAVAIRTALPRPNAAR